MIRGNDGFTVQQLGVPALSTKLRVARAKLWSHGSNNYEDQVILTDSMSEVTFAAEPFLAHGVSKGPLRLHGPTAPDAGRKLIARVEGVVRMKINLDDVDGDEYAVDIQCVRAMDLPRGAAFLLNARGSPAWHHIGSALRARGRCF